MDQAKAIRRAIKAYFDGMSPERSFEATSKRPKYTKKYFDKIEEEHFGDVTTYKNIKEKRAK